MFLFSFRVRLFRFSYLQLFVLAEVAFADVEDFFALHAFVAFAAVALDAVLLFALLVLAINTNLLCGFVSAIIVCIDNTEFIRKNKKFFSDRKV